MFDYAIGFPQLAANGIHGQLIFYRWHIRNTRINGSMSLFRYRYLTKANGS